MAETPQARESSTRAPEREISVDLSEADPRKAVERRAKAPSSDIARNVQDNDDGEGRKGGLERNLYKRMKRFETRMQREFDQKLADREAAHQRELSELRQQFERVGVERGDGAQAASEHERAMKALQDALAAAHEKGDSVEAARITAEMMRAEGAYHAKLSGTKQRADTDPSKAAAGKTPAADATVRRQGPTAAGARFIRANEEWWDDPEFEIEKDAASKIYIELCQDQGFEANSDETFKEVGKRLKAKFPKLPVKAGRPGPDDEDEDEETHEEGEREERGQRRRAAAARITDRGASGQGPRSNRRTLTSEEAKTMRAVGLNPDNDKDVVQFLREAMAMEGAA